MSPTAGRVTAQGDAIDSRYHPSAAVRRQLGTDQPLHTQYVRWIRGALRGDFGHSFFYRTAVLDEIKARLPVTLELSLLTMVASFVIAVPLGVIVASSQDRWPDHLSTIFTVSGVALPTFWVGVLMVYGLSR